MYGMGGMGGYGSYGSSYGSYGGLSSYGSSYGSGYGSYGSYGNNYTNRYGAQASKPTDKNTENKDANNDPNNPNGSLQPEKQKQQQINHRKVIFEEWFKMMGGLRSILELGFAAIALANFWSRSAEIFKKFMEFGKQASKSMGSFIESKIPTKIFTNLSTPEKRGRAIKSIVLMVIRVFAALLLLLGFRLRRDIKLQAQRKEAQIKRELQKMKLQEVQLVEQPQAPQEGKQNSRQPLQEATL